MKTLIVGCGYVGLALGAELARRGHEVFGFRRSPEGAAALRQAGIRPVPGDLTRPSSLAQLPGPFDWVVNTVSSSRGDAEDYRAVYLEGMRTLATWLRGASPKKFVYTSSTGVYGQEDGSWVDETSPTRPATETGRILLETESIALEAAREQRLPAVILRLAGIYGPGRGYWLRRFLEGDPLPADQARRYSNMIHRDDAAGCIAAALERGGSGEIYNGVDDAPVTLAEMFRWLAQELGRPLPSDEGQPSPAPGKRAPTHKRVSNRKLKSQLGYTFLYPTFREGYRAELERLKAGSAV
jgi:nucleoside-diphosphate-sugar epimerase